jgi:hypothetical protein
MLQEVSFTCFTFNDYDTTDSEVLYNYLLLNYIVITICDIAKRIWLYAITHTTDLQIYDKIKTRLIFMNLVGWKIKKCIPISECPQRDGADNSRSDISLKNDDNDSIIKFITDDNTNDVNNNANNNLSNNKSNDEINNNKSSHINKVSQNKVIGCEVGLVLDYKRNIHLKQDSSGNSNDENSRIGSNNLGMFVKYLY